MGNVEDLDDARLDWSNAAEATWSAIAHFGKLWSMVWGGLSMTGFTMICPNLVTKGECVQ